MGESFESFKGSRDTHSALYHYAADKQYAGTNAWNVDNNGNVNTNNKYNGNLAVPASDYDRFNGAEASFSSFWDAYRSCQRNKRGTCNAIEFSLNAVRNTARLWSDAVRGRYKIGRSICFVVERPVRREVFAASFRDRIIHHWIAARVEPLFEEHLFPCMKSNRKDKGTLDAIHEVYDNIATVSDNYTRDAWIYKFDLRGFFMSISKTQLASKLDTFLKERYAGDDKDVLIELTRRVVLHRPERYCLRKCPREMWDALPPEKSLFGQDGDHGIAIGNLTSQMFANFLLREAVAFIRDSGFPRVTEYVDDFVIVHGDKSAILAFIPKLRAYLKNGFGITLHPHKSYIQHYTKGVSFVGGIVRPHRIYLSRRTRRNALLRVNWACHHGVALGKLAATVNSYLGAARRFTAYKFRREIADMVLASPCGRAVWFSNDCNKMKIKKQYRYANQ